MGVFGAMMGGGGDRDIEPDVTAAGEDIYAAALDSCGNEGQVSIIEQMTEDAFIGAVWHAFYGDIPSLHDYCSHPEAVEIILDEANASADSEGASIRDEYEAGDH